MSAHHTPEYTDLPFLKGDGEMATITRSFNWQNHILGIPPNWPQSLRTTISIILNSKFSMFLFWGPQHICFYNDAYRPSLGNNGKHPAVGQMAEAVYPEIWPDIKPLIDQVLNGGEATWSEDQLLPFFRNGQIEDIYWTFSHSPVIDESGVIQGVLVICVETTQKVKMVKELIQNNVSQQQFNHDLIAINQELNDATNNADSLYQELIQSQQDLLFTIKAADLATFDLNPVTNKFAGNALLKSWFGLKPEDEIMLSKATDVIVETDRERVIEAIKLALVFENEGNYDTEYTIINPNDLTRRVVRAKGKTLFNELKQPIRLSGTLQDITEQKRDEVRKNDFIGMVSHELKTPLTSLTAIIQVANIKLENSGDKFLTSAMDKANTQVKKMSSMINGFLNVSRLESGKLHIVKQKFNLEEVLDEVIHETEITISSHPISFEHCGDTQVDADRDKIGSVFTNLISNAVKYSPKGSPIVVKCIAKENYVQVSVQDEGLGVKPADQQKLFDRYYRVNDNQTKHVSGFGIGLYLCAEIIHRHGGKIWVESENNAGSTFNFSLNTVPNTD